MNRMIHNSTVQVQGQPGAAKENKKTKENTKGGGGGGTEKRNGSNPQVGSFVGR